MSRIRLGEETITSMMLGFLQKHPEGLTALQLKGMVKEAGRTDYENVPVMLCQLKGKKWPIIRMPKSTCEHCGRRVTVYKVDKIDPQTEQEGV